MTVLRKLDENRKQQGLIYLERSSTKTKNEIVLRTQYFSRLSHDNENSVFVLCLIPRQNLHQTSNFEKTSIFVKYFK